MRKIHSSAFKIKFMVQFFIGDLDDILIFDIKLYLFFFDRKIGIIKIKKKLQDLQEFEWHPCVPYPFCPT